MNGRINRNGASFRDPSGFVFYANDQLYRQVNNSYQSDYDRLFSSGLYDSLTNNEFLIEHTEVDFPPPVASLAYKIIKPAAIPFISYPYEWSFSQLKDAALTTLQIQRTALELGMTLKDGSAYNIQFHNGKPLLIDTLSFEHYNEGTPWVAYGQFCSHFLAPLVLMTFTDIRLQQLLRVYIDGIPLDLAAPLLPGKTKTKFGLLTHLHLHARSKKHFEQKTASLKKKTVSRRGLSGIIDSLEKTIKKLHLPEQDTEWADYYDNTNYSEQAFERKKKIVSQYLSQLQPTSVWDLGANNGVFSRLASAKNIPTISFDIDPIAVERNYLCAKQENTPNLLPLLLDLTNPSPAIGWANSERSDILSRGKPHTVLVLALIHHLAISNNLPLSHIAEYFNKMADKAVILEFVPKSDSQVQRLLTSRQDIFDNYSETAVEEAFTEYFQLSEKTQIDQSERVLYLFVKP